MMVFYSGILVKHKLKYIGFMLIIMITGCVKKPYPNQINLGECSSVSQNFSFKCPSGSHYHLLLGIPPINEKVNFSTPQKQPVQKIPFAGTVTISQEGKTINSFEFNADKIMKGNWLYAKNLDTFILTSTADTLRKIDSYLKENNQYEITVSFSVIPPKGSALWLSYISLKPQK